MIRTITRRTLVCRESNRSTNYIAPDAITGCLYQCAYCYLRRNKPFGLDIVSNLDDIIDSIDSHVNSLQWPKQPDQTHSNYWTYDIGCNTDVALHYKHQDYKKLFDYFKNSDKAFGSFATKYVNHNLLDYNPNKKMRIRFSLMPQQFSTILEPKTSLINNRIKAIELFYNAGWDVHVNYSPVIAYQGSSLLYKELFEQVNDIVPEHIKSEVLAEVIFLTHDYKMHAYNIENNVEAEKLLWQPQYQEIKKSTYGGNVLRYKHELKSNMIDRFVKLHSSIIPWNTIRYIF